MKLSIGAVAKPGSTRANKTGTWRTFRPVFNADLCVGCGICSQFCPEGVIYKKGEKYVTEQATRGICIPDNTTDPYRRDPFANGGRRRDESRICQG